MSDADGAAAGQYATLLMGGGLIREAPPFRERAKTYRLTLPKDIPAVRFSSLTSLD
jgi:hypothetical protein